MSGISEFRILLCVSLFHSQIPMTPYSLCSSTWDLDLFRLTHFRNSTKRSMRTYLHSYLLFCQYFNLNPFPVSKTMYLLYLVFLSRSLSSYRSVVNYLGIITHINRSFGTSLAFLQDYDVYLAQRAVRRLLGDCVARKEPITIEILLRLFSNFDFHNHLHVCMRALFLVAFFSFLRISNLVPYQLSDIADPQACHLTPSNVTFTSQGALLRITHTKTNNFVSDS